MSKQKFSDLLRDAAAPKDQAMESGYAAAYAVLTKVDRASLAPAQSAKYDNVAESMKRARTDFQAATNQAAVGLGQRIDALKKTRMIGMCAALGVGLIVFLILIKSIGLGFLLALMTIVGWVVFSKIMTGRAATLQAESWAATRQAQATFGVAESLAGPATGLVGLADAVYLDSLDSTARALEMQRRTTEKQMQQMQAQHNAMMAAQAQQMEALRLEQRATNDALYGGPGAVGTFLRARDDAKRRTQK